MGRFAVVAVVLMMLCTSFAIPPIGNLAQGLIAYLPLDEGAGLQAWDYSKNIVGGNAPCTISTCTWGINPRLGKCLTWASANTNKVTIGKPSTMNVATSAVTVSAWIYCTDLSVGVNSGYRYIISDYNAAGSNCQFTMYITNTQKLTFFWCNAGSQVPAPITAAGATTLSTNTLYHFVGTRSGASGAWTVDVYLNGRRDGGATTTTNPPAQSSCGNMVIGQVGDYTAAPLGMVGSIKSLRVYNRALTATEVKDLYNKEYNQIIYGRK